MSKLAPLALTVLTNHLLTPHMRRLTLQAESIAPLEQVSAGSYLKLLFNAQGGTDLSRLTEEQRPAMRTYSIRAIDRSQQTLTLDVVMHGQGQETGPGSDWASKAVTGEQIYMVGPGHLANSAAMEEGADWYFFVGDATALPAISTYLETLPADTQGYAVIQVKTQTDQQTLLKPEGVRLHWVVEAEGQSLLTEVSRLDWLDGRVAAWVACEFDAMRQLRQYFRNERAVPHQDIYISSYWRQGKPEDKHVIDKRIDAQTYTAKLATDINR
ncbi:siderophore-interacting protein [Bowmanella pacifica]|uniref:Siderophore-interacting protein n=1 Tax=Bowmanella pacifica TaxID=502051 RepID=A0A917YV87_9ALTE|nr:siderophore-interacting protein [Bowmanella pacifica]GGO67343.1 siderophore-interacting protein [Bowmanella pacifica]